MVNTYLIIIMFGIGITNIILTQILTELKKQNKPKQ